MIDLDRAVLYFGIAAVLAVATFNHVHANAAQPPSYPVEWAASLNGAAPGPVACAAQAGC